MCLSRIPETLYIQAFAEIVAEIEAFKSAVYENPNLEVEEDFQRLRQKTFVFGHRQRRVEQRVGRGPATRAPRSEPGEQAAEQ